MVKGQKYEEKSFVKKYGFGLFKLVGFNPETKEEISAIGFPVKEDGKEPKYTDTTESGTERARLDFYMEEVNTGYRWKEAFFLENAPSMSREKEGEQQKHEYINSTGQTSWVYNDLELTEKFKEHDYHHAIKGESSVIDFLKKLMNLEWTAEISYNFKKFFNGSFGELKTDLGAAETIIIPLTIKQKENAENPDVIDEFQSSFKAYARGLEYKFVNLKGVTGWTNKDIESIKERHEFNQQLFRDRRTGLREEVKAKWINDVDKIVLKMIDDNYGCKNVYHLGKIKDYGGDALPSTGKVLDETDGSWS